MSSMLINVLVACVFVVGMTAYLYYGVRLELELAIVFSLAIAAILGAVTYASVFAGTFL